MTELLTPPAAPGRAGIDLPYGRGEIRLGLPAGVRTTVVRRLPQPPLPDPAAAVQGALAAPIGAPPLLELARGRRSACIVICDITRPVPNHLFLRPIVEQLLTAGVPLAEITIVVATGLHRPNLGDELERLIGDPWVVEHLRIENHDATDEAQPRSLGTTSTRQTPVALDRRFLDADLKIVTGLVEPHFMAGWSGGRKVIAPGVAHQDTIRTFHSARFMEHPKATSCRLEGNPLHEEQLEIAAMVGEVYALNAVIDEQRRLTAITFGEVVASHLAAVEVVAATVHVPVERRYQTVVTSAAGYPLDQTYYQVVKAMVTPLDLLEPGSTLIVAAECAEGIGSAHFRAAQEKLAQAGPDGFLALVNAKRFADIDEWQTEMALKALRRGQVELWSPGLAAADHTVTGVRVVPDLDAAVAAAVERGVERGGDRSLAVIPEGPYVVPYVTAS